jgi:iron complex transport system ATP-binding protein
MSLRAENITFGYHSHQPVLSDVTLDVQPGKVTALFGPNGCGKSTLLRCLNGSLRPQAGHVSLDGQRIDALTAREVAHEIAVVPQETPVDAPFTAGQMVMLGRYARWGMWGQESAEDRQVVAESLLRVNAADLTARFFNQLSGGERQRVIIARALAQQGRLLLLDEPASHLDISHQLELYRLVRALAQEGQAVLMVCHDLMLAPMFADIAVVMVEGRIISKGPVKDVLTPANIAAAFGTHAEISWTSDGIVQARLM